MVYEDIIDYEHFNEQFHLIALNSNDSTESDLEDRLAGLIQQLEIQFDLQQSKRINLDFKSSINNIAFIEQVNKARASIHSGDTTQIVLSQKLTSEFNEDPFSFYRHLRSSNPSPYMFYLDFTDYLIIG